MSRGSVGHGEDFRLSLSAGGGTRWHCRGDLMEAERSLFQDGSSPNAAPMVWSSKAPGSGVTWGRIVREGGFGPTNTRSALGGHLTIFLCNLAQDCEEMGMWPVAPLTSLSGSRLMRNFVIRISNFSFT